MAPKQQNTQINTRNAAIASGISAYLMWGFLPIYFKVTDAVPPLEILAHRVIWSVVFGALIISLLRNWSGVKAALLDRKALVMLTAATSAMAINWGLYIWAVQNNQILQGSLAYYINPLMFVLVGVFFFGEKMRRWQILAVILATIGVIVLTVYGRQFPWIALVLAACFTIYGTLRKKVNAGPMAGLFIETLVLFIPAIAYLAYLQSGGALYFGGNDLKMNALLMLAGPVTVLPLLAFAFAAPRLSLTTIGFLQFIGPTLQFIVGLHYGETLSLAHILCFGFIWTAVAIFVADAVRANRIQRAQGVLSP